MKRPNALIIVLKPDTDYNSLVHKFWSLPKDRTHIMLLGHGSRNNGFAEWYFSQCGFRVKLITSHQSNDFDLYSIAMIIEKRKWFPISSRLLIAMAEDVESILNDEMSVRMTNKPIYSRDIKVEMV